MISFKELLGSINVADVDLTTQHNLEELKRRMNVVRSAYGQPMLVTSGLRTQQDQMRINPKAPKSKHIMGKACDISDRSGALKAWILANVEILESAGLWCEDFAHTPTWVHFQSEPPRSGKRFFIP